MKNRFLFQAFLVGFDGRLETQVQGIADKGVTYRDFGQVRNMLLEKFEVMQTQIMTCIHP